MPDLSNIFLEIEFHIFEIGGTKVGISLKDLATTYSEAKLKICVTFVVDFVTTFILSFFLVLTSIIYNFGFLDRRRIRDLWLVQNNFNRVFISVFGKQAIV
jgi:hypothetical protein